MAIFALLALVWLMLTTAVEPWSPTGIDVIDRAVVTWRSSQMVPAQFTDKQGKILVGALALAAHWLHALDLEPVPNIPQLYVIKGRVGIMAELQRVLLARAGYDLDIIETTDDVATVRIRQVGGRWYRPVTVTMAQAHRAGWDKPPTSGELSNYEKIPDRMLLARACTKAISLNAPGVLHGVTAPALSVAELIEEDDDEFSGEVGGEVRPADPESSRQADAGGPTTTPSGATIPVAQREPPCPPELRAQLIERRDALQLRAPAELAELRRSIEPAKIPNLQHSENLTVAHAWLLDRLFADLERENPEPIETDDPVPDHVYDDAPEAYEPTRPGASHRMASVPDDGDDPGRPFT